MEDIATGVKLIELWRGYRINVYLLDDVLVDTGTRWDCQRLLARLEGVHLTSVVLTHAHPDHQGGVHRICTALGVPLACPVADASAMEGRRPLPPHHFLGRVVVPLLAGPSHPVSRALFEGDTVGTFKVINAAGHTPGHCILYRESDRIMIAGDVLANMNFVTGRTGLREPPRLFSTDWRQNRRSIKKLMSLEPALVCFGHGPPLRDIAKLKEFYDAQCERETANV